MCQALLWVMKIINLALFLSYKELLLAKTRKAAHCGVFQVPSIERGTQ